MTFFFLTLIDFGVFCCCFISPNTFWNEFVGGNPNFLNVKSEWTEHSDLGSQFTHWPDMLALKSFRKSKDKLKLFLQFSLFSCWFCLGEFHNEKFINLLHARFAYNYIYIYIYMYIYNLHLPLLLLLHLHNISHLLLHLHFHLHFHLHLQVLSNLLLHLHLDIFTFFPI